MGVNERTVRNADGVLIEQELASSSQDSLEVSQNAKGERTFSVKVYGRNPDEIASALAAYVTLAESYVKKGGA